MKIFRDLSKDPQNSLHREERKQGGPSGLGSGIACWCSDFKSTHDCEMDLISLVAW